MIIHVSYEYMFMYHVHVHVCTWTECLRRHSAPNTSKTSLCNCSALLFDVLRVQRNIPRMAAYISLFRTLNENVPHFSINRSFLLLRLQTCWFFLFFDNQSSTSFIKYAVRMFTVVAGDSLVFEPLRLVHQQHTTGTRSLRTLKQDGLHLVPSQRRESATGEQPLQAGRARRALAVGAAKPARALAGALPAQHDAARLVSRFPAVSRPPHADRTCRLHARCLHVDWDGDDPDKLAECVPTGNGVTDGPVRRQSARW